MKVIANGIARRVLGGGVGPNSENRLTEIGYIKNGRIKKIWPSSSFARRIEFEAPQPGTLDYLYWQHAMRAIKDRTRRGNLMYIADDRIKYYIEQSQDATEPYRLNGNELIVDFEGLPLSFFSSSTLEIVANINAWEAPGQGQDAVLDVPRSYYWDYPLLPQTKLVADWYGGKKGHHRSLNLEFIGEPSKTVYFRDNMWKNGTGRGDYNNELITTVQNVNAGDTGLNANVALNAFAGILPKGIRPIFPHFLKTFKLKILSIE